MSAPYYFRWLRYVMLIFITGAFGAVAFSAFADEQLGQAHLPLSIRNGTTFPVLITLQSADDCLLKGLTKKFAVSIGVSRVTKLPDEWVGNCQNDQATITWKMQMLGHNGALLLTQLWTYKLADMSTNNARAFFSVTPEDRPSYQRLMNRGYITVRAVCGKEKWFCRMPGGSKGLPSEHFDLTIGIVWNAVRARPKTGICGLFDCGGDN